MWALAGGGRVMERGRLFEEIWYLVSFFNDIATSIEELGNNYGQFGGGGGVGNFPWTVLPSIQ